MPKLYSPCTSCVDANIKEGAMDGVKVGSTRVGFAGTY